MGTGERHAPCWLEKRTDATLLPLTPKDLPPTPLPFTPLPYLVPEALHPSPQLTLCAEHPPSRCQVGVPTLHPPIEEPKSSWRAGELGQLRGGCGHLR